MPKIILYHGSPNKFDKFEIKNIPNSVEQDGPGIYLTTSEKEAYRYSEGNCIYKVEWEYNKLLNNKEQSKRALMNLTGKVKKAFYMLDKDRLETVLSNWGENPRKALNNVIETCIDSAYSEKDVFLNVWAEGYMKRSTQFCEMMTKLGYDGHIVEFDGVNHIIAFNPNNIKILEMKDKIIDELEEDITLDIDKGDTILTGRFKNHKVEVKDIGKDEHEMPTVNGKQITKIRIPKLEETAYLNKNTKMKLENEDKIKKILLKLEEQVDRESKSKKPTEKVVIKESVINALIELWNSNAHTITPDMTDGGLFKIAVGMIIGGTGMTVAHYKWNQIMSYLQKVPAKFKKVITAAKIIKSSKSKEEVDQKLGNEGINI